MQYKKKLGQHFLKDQKIVDKLVRHINPSANDEIIEIGPGDGVMTKSIINPRKDFETNLLGTFNVLDNKSVIGDNDLRMALRNIRTYVEKNCENVGDNFANEARLISKGK